MLEPSFKSDAVGFDITNAHFLAHVSRLVYSDKTTVRKTMRKWKFRRCRSISVNETQLCVTGNDDAVVIAFRGTEQNIMDWMTDFRITLVGGPWGRVHEGFSLALADVWSKVVEAVEDYKDNGQGVWFTGHSLGAALATLATAKFRERAWSVRGLYTYGSPRCGGETFAQNFNSDFGSRTYRFVNDQDIVTRVPPRRSFGYRHVGEVCFLNADGTLTADPSAWSRFLDHVTGAFDRVKDRDIEAIEDHAITQYISKIEGIINHVS